MILRPLLRPVLRSPFEVGGGFSPLSIPGIAANGLVLDPSDFSTGFQNSTGTIQQSATGQSTGLRLDKRLPHGAPVALYEGTTTGWTAANNGVLTIVDGSMRITNGGAAFGCARKTFTTEVGKWYEIVAAFTLSNETDGSVWVGTTEGGFDLLDTDTRQRGLFQATGTTTHIQVLNATPTEGAFFDLDALTFGEVDGNHVLQTTASFRPELFVEGAVVSDFFDETDDGYSTAAFAAGTFTADMDCFVAIRRLGTGAHTVISENPADATRYFCNYAAANPGSAVAGVGSVWSHFVNGVAVGTENSCTAGQLDTAIGSDEWKVLEVRNLDLSSWEQFTIGLYTGAMFGGDIGGVIVCPAQAAEERARIRRWLGSRVGLSL